MSDGIYDGVMQYTLIYIFEIPDDAHKGYLKIGEHRFASPSSYKQLTPNCEELNRQAKSRIDQYTKTALVKYNLLHTELARVRIRLKDETIESRSFSDRDVHEVLDRSGFDVHKFYDTDRDSEWYKVDLRRAIAAIGAVKSGRNVLTAAEMSGAPTVSENRETDATHETKPAAIALRDEQKRCVEKTAAVFKRSDRMLWDCKMRFGKTVTAYALVKKLNFQKAIVVTHRPVVVDGWKSDFRLMFDDDRAFVTKANIKGGGTVSPKTTPESTRRTTAG